MRMKKLLIILLLLTTICTKGQNYQLKAGDRFPDLTFQPLINAPVKELYLNKYPSKKLFIINFWGTWCSPCIPEMDSLSKLQNKYAGQIQVVGISNDSPEKLRKYLLKKPSKIWLASDTTYLLYQMLNLASVGHSAIIDANKKIVAVVKTDSVNAKMINLLLKGKRVASNASIAEVSNLEKDAFGVDSLQTSSFTIRSYMKGQHTMGRAPNNGPFAYRRVSYYNIPLVTLYRSAYDIHTEKQLILEFDKKKYDNFEDKRQLYCFDLLVKAEDKDSLLTIMQRKLNESLPVKSRTEMRDMPVYVLKQKPGVPLNIKESSSTKLDYGFNGNGFNGQATLSEFGHLYLSNELQLPVINETGLTKRYQIVTTNDLRDKENILKAIDKLGLMVEKTERPVKVIILYEDKQSQVAQAKP
jgi:uncharacterized protein (TIGR03435 family)